MSYFNMHEAFGITKYIRGPNITQYQRKNQKEEFEARIFLEQQILKVASLPGYESILELDDKNKIVPGIKYRFFILGQFPGDIIEITEIIESNTSENDIF